MSSAETMLYRSKTERVRWPEISIATRSGVPALTMFRIAVRRKSWKNLPGTPAYGRRSPTLRGNRPGVLPAL